MNYYSPAELLKLLTTPEPEGIYSPESLRMALVKFLSDSDGIVFMTTERSFQFRTAGGRTMKVSIKEVTE